MSYYFDLDTLKTKNGKISAMDKKGNEVFNKNISDLRYLFLVKKAISKNIGIEFTIGFMLVIGILGGLMIHDAFLIFLPTAIALAMIIQFIRFIKKETRKSNKSSIVFLFHDEEVTLDTFESNEYKDEDEKNEPEIFFTDFNKKVDKDVYLHLKKELKELNKNLETATIDDFDDIASALESILEKKEKKNKTA